MARYDWSNCITSLAFNPNDVRDPTVIYNNVGLVYGGPIVGYTGTDYAFEPINFEPSVGAVDHTIPYKWKQIPLDQFLRDPVTGDIPDAKQALITLNSGTSGANMWNRVVYAWARKPGTAWNLSPIFNGGYLTSLLIAAPIGAITKADGTQVPGIEIAWGVNSLDGSAVDTTNWGTGNPINGVVSLVGILTGWGK